MSQYCENIEKQGFFLLFENFSSDGIYPLLNLLPAEGDTLSNLKNKSPLILFNL